MQIPSSVGRRKRIVPARLMIAVATLSVLASSCSRAEVLGQMRPAFMPTLNRYGLGDQYEALIGPLAQTIADWINMQLRMRGITL